MTFDLADIQRHAENELDTIAAQLEGPGRKVMAVAVILQRDEDGEWIAAAFTRFGRDAGQEPYVLEFAEGLDMLGMQLRSL